MPFDPTDIALTVLKIAIVLGAMLNVTPSAAAARSFRIAQGRIASGRSACCSRSPTR
jgi:hypothetical protein